jgi:hypothetical protein
VIGCLEKSVIITTRCVVAQNSAVLEGKESTVSHNNIRVFIKLNLVYEGCDWRYSSYLCIFISQRDFPRNSKTQTFKTMRRLKKATIRAYPELIPFTFHPLNLFSLCLS